MLEKLTVLLKIQQLDDKESELLSLREAAEHSIIECKKRLDCLQNKQKQHSEELSEHRKKLAVLNGELRAVEDKIIKNKEKSQSVTSEKQLNAMNSELESMNNQKSLLEEEILLGMEREESLSEIEEKLQSELKEVTNTFSAAELDLVLSKPEWEQNLAEVRRNRTRVAESADRVSLSLYQRIRTRHASVVVPVRDGTCEGCRIKLDHNTVNDLINQDSLVCCSNCSRILFVEEVLDQE
ncbi:MAG: C4-type zinc ribbon domain-containing protein [Candidatus Wallbacteria bacterium]|nr:C4-type zinc ribbon domain-containing protein [Candidatus Wallbacteria bacterium]